ncbi:MAG TPA: hypothetical protein VMW19_09645 [Myxococcota bacterium]|nr:hypothetical protein [Myxococcota bacterium]
MVDVDHQHEGGLARASHAVDLARERELELTTIGETCQGIAARELAEAVDRALQPGDAARLGADGPRVAGLLEQQQRRAQAQR